jgi:hypothetical protein
MANNRRVAVVGPPTGGQKVSAQKVSAHPPPRVAGVPVEFDSIQKAINAVEPGPGFMDRATVYVTTGLYFEQITCKPHVNIVGISKESAYIFPPAGSTGPTIRLSRDANISDLSLMNSAEMAQDAYAIQGENVEGVGIRNVDIYPVGDPDPRTNKGRPFSVGRGLSIRGKSHSIIVQSLGYSYWGRANAIEILGPVDESYNVDCHFIDCFIDALWMDEWYRAAFWVRNCEEVHIRNTLIRVDNLRLESIDEKYEVAAVYTQSTIRQAKTNVHLESSTLDCGRIHNDRVLTVGKNTACFFKASATAGYWLEPADRNELESQAGYLARIDLGRCRDLRPC